jgi:hypothetical protein
MPIKTMAITFKETYFCKSYKALQRDPFQATTKNF